MRSTRGLATRRHPAWGPAPKRPTPVSNGRLGGIQRHFKGLRTSSSGSSAKRLCGAYFVPRATPNFPGTAFSCPRNHNRFSRHPPVFGDKIPRALGDKILSGQRNAKFLRQRVSVPEFTAEPKFSQTNYPINALASRLSTERRVAVTVTVLPVSKIVDTGETPACSKSSSRATAQTRPPLVRVLVVTERGVAALPTSVPSLDLS